MSLVFEDKNIGILYITPDWVKWLFTSPVDKLNVTVIEFSLTALNVLSRMKYERLTPEVPVANEVVSVFQYCNGSLNFGKGRVNKVNGKIINYILNTEQYSCGFPLLNERLKVVGIHVNSINLEERESFKAITIGSIFKAFKIFVKEQLGGRTENELWLEKIVYIPKKEFQLIGSGGFGKVYKIKENISTETFVAVKVVSGLGKLDEYENQVRSLQKEYRLVTRLGNHPRIIQFFAIIPDDRNYQIMIVMEFMERGSLADKLTHHMPLPDSSVLKYLTQLLEGLSFLHRKKIYHSDIEPANLLITSEDNLKISDFGIAVGSQLQTKSSATSSHFQGDFHYMSPERLNGADRSAANDIWSVGATFVHMISGESLNHRDSVTQLLMNISQHKLFIKEKPFIDYLQTLNNNDFKKKILSQILRYKSNRANSQKLFRILFPHTNRLPAEALMAAGVIWGLSYNAARDELFVADIKVVLAIRLQDNAGDMREVYRCRCTAQGVSYVSSVCHMSDSDSLLVCTREDWQYASWLVLLRRAGSEWRETHRVHSAQTGLVAMMCCALSDSRALVGQYYSTSMELFHVQSDARIAHVHRIDVSERYLWLAASSGSDTLVAMSYLSPDESVRVNRLRD